jgi:glucan-binding YG repeat protein
MKKKLLSVLLSVAVIFAFLPAVVYADHPDYGWDETHTHYYEDGVVQTGWIEEYDYYYYADPAKGGAVATGWKKIGGSWYYFAPKEGESNGYYFEKGTMYCQGPMLVNGRYYYFGTGQNGQKYGVMQTGWVKEVFDYDDGDGITETVVLWYYADPANDSRLAAGWKKIKGKWYYFDKAQDCVMLCNEVREINKKLYVFDRNGALYEKAGWIDLYETWNDNGKKVKEFWWVYSKKDGTATTGWKKISGTWYHFGKEGYMTSNDWAKDSKGWMWMGANGKAVKNRWIKWSVNAGGDGEWYFIKSNGYMAAKAWVKDSHGWMWMGANGKITKNKWIKSGGYWYYLKADGYMATGKLTIDGKTYNFNSSGKWIP